MRPPLCCFEIPHEGLQFRDSAEVRRASSRQQPHWFYMASRRRLDLDWVQTRGTAAIPVRKHGAGAKSWSGSAGQNQLVLFRSPSSAVLLETHRLTTRSSFTTDEAPVVSLCCVVYICCGNVHHAERSYISNMLCLRHDPMPVSSQPALPVSDGLQRALYL
jgi:hypothetical protein